MKKNHLLIAGTGRAGTTFLVQYLAACGLETQLAHKGHHAYDEDANAGLEDILLGQADAPYVSKSPWLFEYVERLLADDKVVIDAVIVPMRSLVEAASSRVVNEMRARYSAAAIPDDSKQWTSWAMTAGGVVYSLNPLDQARLLALGFHDLLHAFVKRDIRVVLLDFPRFVEDANYLYEALHSILADKVERMTALRAHASVASPDKVRVGRELAADDAMKHRTGSDGPPQGLVFPSHAALDRMALTRELDKTRATLAGTSRGLEQANDALHTSRQESVRTRAELIEAHGQLEGMRAQADRVQDELSKAKSALAKSDAELNEAKSALATAKARIAHLELRRDALEASTSWRATAPLRALSGLVRRKG